jgi:hypothetical protein
MSVFLATLYAVGGWLDVSDHVGKANDWIERGPHFMA